MPKKILVIDGHPNPKSYCNAIADTYAETAEKAGHSVRRLTIRDLEFDPILHKGYSEIQPLETDLEAAKEDIIWCEHLVWVFPLWWGMYPALMKGFIDRLILPPWAFKYHKNDPWWDKHLTGRSAHLFVTMDMPPWYFRLVYARPAINALRKVTLGFVGFKPVRYTPFAVVKRSDASKRKKWLEKVAKLAVKGK